MWWLHWSFTSRAFSRCFCPKWLTANHKYSHTCRLGEYNQQSSITRRLLHHWATAAGPALYLQMVSSLNGKSFVLVRVFFHVLKMLYIIIVHTKSFVCNSSHPQSLYPWTLSPTHTSPSLSSLMMRNGVDRCWYHSPALSLISIPSLLCVLIFFTFR